MNAKQSSTFFPVTLRNRLRANTTRSELGRQLRQQIIDAAAPWLKMADGELRGLMFGPTITRSWEVWAAGYCPACQGSATQFAWEADALRHPWKMRCPHCHELFPKNDFYRFYQSGLDAAGVFDPPRADRTLLFNKEHPDPHDPLHKFGVDDGEGYVEGDKRWRFIGNYLVVGQWWQLVLTGLRNLAAAHVITGEAAYARKAGVLLERIAELHPEFDWGQQGMNYSRRGERGYVSTWHHANVEVRDLAVAYDQVCEELPVPLRHKIEERILRDVLANPRKITSNYPHTDISIILLKMVLEWPANRAEVAAAIDEMLRHATAVDGLTGEKGLCNYACAAPTAIALLLSFLTLLPGDYFAQLFRRHPRLRDLYRFHIDTWCLQQYYPLVGDGHWFGKRFLRNPAIPWDNNYEFLPTLPLPGLTPSAYTLCWRIYEATGDAAFVQLLHHANGNSLQNLPHDLYTDDPAALQQQVQAVLHQAGAALNLGSINKEQWHLAVLRAGQGDDALAAWLSYDSGGGHAHMSGMNLGLCAKGFDLMPENGYPAVNIAGFQGKYFDWGWSTAAHNTVVIDGQNQTRFDGQTTLWAAGKNFQAIRVQPEMHPNRSGGDQICLYCMTPSQISLVRVWTKPESGGDWQLQFTDQFDRAILGPDWKIIEGDWRIENGKLTGAGTLFCTRSFPGSQRLEFEARTTAPTPCDLSAVLAGDGVRLASGIFFAFGTRHNQLSVIMPKIGGARNCDATRSNVVIQPGRLHRIQCERDGLDLRHWVDGVLIQQCRNDGLPHIAGVKKRYERTVVLLDRYLVDIFRVAGGQDQAKFFHSYYGTVTPRGLNLQSAPEYGHGTLLRNFRTDLNPAPGWSVDWQIQDRHHYLPAPRDIHLRYTDLTMGAAASLCEGWVAVQSYESNEVAWVPRVMVRRQAAESTFVAVLEPYEGHSAIAGIQRLPTATEGDVLIEVKFVDGRRDLIFSADAGLQTDALATDGALGWIRYTPAGAVAHIALCHGQKLRAGPAVVELSAKADFYEPTLPG